MSKYLDSPLLTRVGFRRKLLTFVTVACTLFILLSLFWPMSTSVWRSQSEIAFSLTERPNSDKDFSHVLREIVDRHTSPAGIEQLIVRHGLTPANQAQDSTQLAASVRDGLNVRLLQDVEEGRSIKLMIGLEGDPSPNKNFFVNALATSLARDFMMSPIATLMPADSPDFDEFDSLEQRRQELQNRATDLIAQIEGNFSGAESDWQNNDTGDDLLDPGSLVGTDSKRDQMESELQQLQLKRSRLVGDDPWSLDLASMDDQISEKRAQIAALANNSQTSQSSPFRNASFRSGKSGSGVSASTTTSLRDAVNQLASITSEATMAAKTAGRGPAFSIDSVHGKSVEPVGAIPSSRHLFLLMLAAGGIAGIVTFAYQPFAMKGFESVQNVSKQLKVPVVATLRKEQSQDHGVSGEDSGDELPRANRLVTGCEWILFGVLMLVIGFCLVNADIRNSFFQNPFYGFARIFWVLRGH